MKSKGVKNALICRTDKIYLLSNFVFLLIQNTILSYPLWEKIDDKVNKLEANYLRNTDFEFDKLIEENKNETVVAHNDIWANNLLFNKNDDGTVGNEPTIIDWQDFTEGAITLDLSSILLNCVESDLRHHIEQKYLPEYYERLKAACEDNKVKFDMTFEKFQRNYDCSFLNQTMYSMMDLGLLFNGNNIPRESGNEYWDKKKYKLGLNIYAFLCDSIEKAQRINSKWLD
uniref:CHK domain-containing protein n=1 Tax=Rhabditophanes sp. KR3021 TaxID=114890 RepID=A0AC35TH22_9BILA